MSDTINRDELRTALAELEANRDERRQVARYTASEHEWKTVVEPGLMRIDNEHRTLRREHEGLFERTARAYCDIKPASAEEINAIATQLDLPLRNARELWRACERFHGIAESPAAVDADRRMFAQQYQQIPADVATAEQPTDRAGDTPSTVGPTDTKNNR